MIELGLGKHSKCRSLTLPALVLGAWACFWGSMPATGQSDAVGSPTAPSLITQAVNPAQLTTLSGHVRSDLSAGQDLGAVQDALPLRLYLVLRRSPEQQAFVSEACRFRACGEQ